MSNSHYIHTTVSYLGSSDKILFYTYLYDTIVLPCYELFDIYLSSDISLYQQICIALAYSNHHLFFCLL